jgi:hypothetical protein
MTADEAEEAIRKWEKDWKRDRDKLHRKSHGGPTVDGCSFVDGTIGYTGCISEKFQPLAEVTNAPLLEGHTFPDKEIVLMRIVEEANLYGVRIKIIWSDGFQVNAWGVNGDPFHVVAYYGTTTFSGRLQSVSHGMRGWHMFLWRRVRRKPLGRAWVRIVPYLLLMFRTYLLHHQMKQLGMSLRIH